MESMQMSVTAQIQEVRQLRTRKTEDKPSEVWRTVAKCAVMGGTIEAIVDATHATFSKFVGHTAKVLLQLQFDRKGQPEFVGVDCQAVK